MKTSTKTPTEGVKTYISVQYFSSKQFFLVIIICKDTQKTWITNRQIKYFFASSKIVAPLHYETIPLKGTMLATDNVSHPKCEEKRNFAKIFLYVGKKM
ncbi:MAG: hypothetical protein IKN11_01965 [Bacteroidales bacterium]|nr:hypothetical protein [Bacteroidales bacterium]